MIKRDNESIRSDAYKIHNGFSNDKKTKWNREKRAGGKWRKTRSARARGLSLFSVTTRPRSREYLKKFV